MSESKEDMQNQLNVFNDFCKKWKLKANLKFTYNNRDLEIVPNFSYLGVDIVLTNYEVYLSSILHT
jgi:hypothetical protein